MAVIIELQRVFLIQYTSFWWRKTSILVQNFKFLVQKTSTLV